MSNPLVIDVSHWQSGVNFAKLKAAGTIGVILKATQGTTYVDPTFKERYFDALTAGLCVSTYHFLTHGNIEAQMKFYIETVKPIAGDRLIIDFEREDGKTAPTLAELEQAAQYLLDNSMCEVSVYGASGFLGAVLGGEKSIVLSKTSLWVASYTSADKPTMTNMNGTWPTWSLWQYSQTGKVDGVNGDTDVSRWNGDPSSLSGWFHLSRVTPAPAPAPEPNPVQDVVVAVDIAAPEGVTLKVSLNGKPL